MAAATAAAKSEQQTEITADAKAIIKDLQPNNRKLAESSLQAICFGLRAGDESVLTAYVQDSPLCEELFLIWNSLEASENSRLASFVLEVLANVLEGHFTVSARCARTSISVASRILTERLATIIRYFSSERDQLLRACLRVLAAVNAQTASMSWQLLRTFSFDNEKFVRLAHRRMKATPKEGEAPPKDVRLYYIQFALGFLRWKEPNLSSSAMCIKGFLSNIFPGLSEDPAETVAQCLSDFLELAVKPRQIARPPKLFLFSAFALRHLCKLLNSSNCEVQQHAQDFIIALCSNRFLFRQQQAQLLLDMLLDLKPLRERQQEVTLALLQAHPSLQLPFCQRLNMSLQAQGSRSEQYLLNVRFLLKFLPLTDGFARLEQQAGSIDDEQDAQKKTAKRLAPAMAALLPKVVQKAHLTQALLQADPVIQLCALSVIKAILTRVVQAINVNLSLNEMQRDKLLQHVQQNIPELNSLLLLWQKLLRPPEATAIEVEDGASSITVGALAAKCLGLPEGGLRPDVAFVLWCETVEAYCTVLPRAVLDITFDFTKLFRALLGAFIPGINPPSGTGSNSGNGKQQQQQQSNVALGSLGQASAWLLPCIHCVVVALEQSGRFGGAFLSRPALLFVELLLQLRGALLRGEVVGLDDGPAKLLEACDNTIHKCCEPLEVFGAEPSCEVALWLSQLVSRPKCISFFCHVLHLVSTKPGFVSSHFQDTFASTPGAGSGDVAAQESITDVTGAQAQDTLSVRFPSLFIVAAVGELARRDLKALGASADLSDCDKDSFALACATLVKVVMGLLAALLPPAAPQFLHLATRRGPWAEQPSATAASVSSKGSGQKTPEAVRESLVLRLQRIVDSQQESGETEAALGGALYALMRPSGQRDEEGGKRKKEKAALDCAATLTELLQALPRGVHCMVYTLLETVKHSFPAAGQSASLGNLCLAALIDLTPAAADSTSEVVDYALRHPCWSAMTSQAPAKASESRRFASLLAVSSLSRLLTAKARRSAASRRLGEAEPRLLQHVAESLEPLLDGVAAPSSAADPGELETDSGLGQSCSAGASSSGGSVSSTAMPQSWKEQIAAMGTNTTSSAVVTIVAGDLVRLGCEAGLLEHLVGNILPKLSRSEFRVAVLMELLAGGRFQLLSHRSRATVMQQAMQEVAGRDTVGPSDMDALATRLLSVDWESLLHFSWKASSKWLMPKGKRKREATQSSHAPPALSLLEHTCRVNVQLRRDLLRQLRWDSVAGGPATALRLVVRLAPLEKALPLLEDAAAMAAIDPSSLLPLPPSRQLLALLRTHPSQPLRKLLKAAASAASKPMLALLLEMETRKPARVQKAMLTYLAAVASAGGGQGKRKTKEGSEGCRNLRRCREALRLSEALLMIGTPSDELLDALRSHCKAVLKEGVPEAVATVLSGLLAAITGEEPFRNDGEATRSNLQPWQVKIACDLLLRQPDEEALQTLEEATSCEPWLLAHAARWWPYLQDEEETDQEKKAKKAKTDSSSASRGGGSTKPSASWKESLLAEIRRGYNATCSFEDRCRRAVLISEASTRSELSETRPWSFRAWASSLPTWQQDVPGASWSWVLEPQRRRTTLDAFWFARPFHDAIPWAHAAPATVNVNAQASMAVAGQVPGKHRQQKKDDVKAAVSSEPYDIGYLVPFVAGQLRAHWAEHGRNTPVSRNVVAPLLSSIVSGGVLEVLLLSCSCSSRILRSCAFESLAIVMAFSGFWEASMPQSAAAKEGKTERLPFRELPEILRLLQSVRDAIESVSAVADPTQLVPEALPTLTSSFAAACVPVLLQPQHFLYLRLGLYLLRRPHLVLGEVPLFYRLLFSGKPQQSDDTRLWLFQLLRRSLGKQGLVASPEEDDAHQLQLQQLNHGTGEDLQEGIDAGAVELDERMANGGARSAATKSIDGSENWSHKPTRDALNRRYAVQWMLSFASSQELGTFPVWLEVAASVEAILADVAGGFGSSASFGLMSWLHREANRRWLGASRAQQSQALAALSKVLQALLGHSKSLEQVTLEGANPVELVQAGSALEALVAAWARVRGPNTGDIGEPGETSGGSSDVRAVLWDLCQQFASLSRAVVMANAKRTQATWPQCHGADVAAAACQLDAILCQLFLLVDRDASGSGAQVALAHVALGSQVASPGGLSMTARRASWGRLLLQVLGMLQISPLNESLHGLAILAMQEIFAAAEQTQECDPAVGQSKKCRRRQPETISTEQEAKPDQDEDDIADAEEAKDAAGVTWPDFILPEEAEISILAALGRCLAALRSTKAYERASSTSGAGTKHDADEAEDRAIPSVCRFVQAVVLLPFSPARAWKVQTLACTVLAMHAAPSSLKELPEEMIQALPHPDLALRDVAMLVELHHTERGATPPEPLPDQEEEWALNAAKLLQKLLAA